MTLFGVDVSHHQSGINLQNLSGIDFVFAKLTEGRGFWDSQFRIYHEQARETDLLFAGYHFLRGDSTPQEQAENVAAALTAVDALDVPVVIDIERTNGMPQPDMRHVRGFRSAADALGVHVPTLLYFPEWYWHEIGRPDIGGWSLWQSDYGSNDGNYPGDDSSRWIAMGRQADVLQFTSNGKVTGYHSRVDINAFRGSREELAQKGWFIDYKEHEMATKAEIQAWVATTPIVVDAVGNTQPLQKVLRQILNRADGPSAEEIASKVVSSLPPDKDLTSADVRSALISVLRGGTDAG